MTDLFFLSLPFFALVLMGWGAARRGLMPLEGIGAMNTFVLYFALSAMLFRLGASGALLQEGLLGLLLAYGAAGVAVTGLGLVFAARMGLSRRDGGLLALITTFPNTGFLGLPLLTGLLGPQAAGPVAATVVVDVLLFSSVCLAWAHSHASREALAPGGDPHEALHAAQASLKGALRNPLLWSMALGMLAFQLRWQPPKPVDETLRLLALSATPTALFTLGAMLARSQMRPGGQVARPVVIAVPVLVKLLAHPLLVCAAGWALQRMGVALSPVGLLTVALAAALPSASNVSMLAEREGANTALVTRVILWTTAIAVISVTVWAHALGASSP